MPVTLPSWPATMMTATPAMYPTRTGGEQLGEEAEPGDISDEAHHPHHEREDRCEAGIPTGVTERERSDGGRRHQGGRRPGPTESWRDEPKKA